MQDDAKPENTDEEPPQDSEAEQQPIKDDSSFPSAEAIQVPPTEQPALTSFELPLEEAPTEGVSHLPCSYWSLCPSEADEYHTIMGVG